MATADPPVHTKLRRLVSKAFTPRRISELEPRIRQIAGELLSNTEGSSEIDAMAALANPLPMIAIAELLGISVADHAQFRRWSDDLVSSFAQDLASGPAAAGFAAEEALRSYLGEAIKQRRRNPSDDLISALVAARDEHDALSENESVALVILLVLAGNETTAKLIGNGLLALSRHFDRQRQLREQPTLIPRAIEEMLRYDSPVQLTLRIAATTVVSGTEIPTGSLAIILLGAANRDPAQFQRPELFDVGREPNEQAALGEGIHFCLGSPFARLEAAVAIDLMLEKFQRLRLANLEAKLEYRASLALRGLSKVPLMVH